jgi:transposase
MKHSEYSRMRVRVLHELGHSIRQIKAETGRPTNFIQRWIGRQDVQRQEGTGRTVKITRGIVHQIYKRMAMKKCKSTSVW